MLDLKSKGFKLILVSNQPDVSLGKISKLFVDNVNDFLSTHLELDLVKV